MTTLATTELLESLRRLGWAVTPASARDPLPAALCSRYPWLPVDFRDFAQAAATVVNPKDTSWFLTATEYARGTSGSAFAWNAWELLSLEAAGARTAEIEATRAFWDAHLPILNSVGDGYAYLAIRRDDLAIVGGDEPYFEEPAPVASSFSELMEGIMLGSSVAARWLAP